MQTDNRAAFPWRTLKESSLTFVFFFKSNLWICPCWNVDANGIDCMYNFLNRSNVYQTGKRRISLHFKFFFFHLYFPSQWSKAAKKINTKRHHVWALLFSMFTRRWEWNYENPGFSPHTFVTKKCLIFMLCLTNHNTKIGETTSLLYASESYLSPNVSGYNHSLSGFFTFFWPNNLEAGEQTFKEKWPRDATKARIQALYTFVWDRTLNNTIN